MEMCQNKANEKICLVKLKGKASGTNNNFPQFLYVMTSTMSLLNFDWRIQEHLAQKGLFLTGWQSGNKAAITSERFDQTLTNQFKTFNYILLYCSEKL